MSIAITEKGIFKIWKYKINPLLDVSTFLQGRDIITLFLIKRLDDWYFPRKSVIWRDNRNLGRIDTLIEVSGIEYLARER